MLDTQKFIELISHCHKMRTKKYKRGELVSTYISNRTQIGIIIEGSADLIRYDIDGNKTIIDRFNIGNIYGEIFHPKENINGLMIEAVTNVIIAQVEYNDKTIFY